MKSLGLPDASNQRGEALTTATTPAPVMQLANAEIAQASDAALAPHASSTQPIQQDALARARAFAEPLLASEVLDTGENILAHADAVAAILRGIGGSQAMQAACYLVYASNYLNKPHEVIAKAFGDNFADLALETSKLVRLQRMARVTQTAAKHAATSAATSTSASNAPMAQTVAAQTESVRKMLLAFSRDLRVVMLRLASRLQTLRHYAATKLPVPSDIATEALHVFAPLANRLGIWEIKWEMEDLAFRFLEPQTYKEIAKLLDEKRSERETAVQALRQNLSDALAAQGVQAQVQGRPKHIYSIVKKMRGKALLFEQLYDIRALRIVVPSVTDCYTVLAWVHSHFTPISNEFDDYIARPKANGYQSLHTVVRDAKGQAIEVQVRTQAMHDAAEHGVAAHWVYKEAGTKGYAGVSATGSYDAKIAVLRQLLAWERELSGAGREVAHGAAPNMASNAAATTAPTTASGITNASNALLDDYIYVLTPDAAVLELPQGATAVDFAYSVHTSLGHRCRGAKVDGMIVPLSTRLKNGQTVEISAVKEGGPSRDWLNPELGYLASHRARTKVRAWFNAQAMDETIAKGRDAVEKLLAREGKTAIKLDDLAVQLGLANAKEMFEVVGKDELSLRSIEMVLRPQAQPTDEANPESLIFNKPQASGASRGGVLVVGVDSLMTQLAKCCKPAPPDVIGGFVTRGKGVSVHRTDCSNFRNMLLRSSERCIDVAWGKTEAAGHVYAVDVVVEANERPGIFREVLDVLNKERSKVIAAQSQSTKDTIRMAFTVEVNQTERLNKVLAQVAELRGVRLARRR